MFWVALLIFGWNWWRCQAEKLHLACRCILSADRPGPHLTAVKSHKPAALIKRAGTKTGHGVIYDSQLWLSVSLFFLIGWSSLGFFFLHNIKYWRNSNIFKYIMTGYLYSSTSSRWRWEAVPLFLGGMWVALRPLWWADTPLQETYRGKAFSVWSV